MKALKPNSLSDFRKWASLFSGEIFVNLAVYVDESGTHDAMGVKSGAEVIIAAGLGAKVESWIKFNNDWRLVLGKYDADYFHFYDFADASKVARGRKPNSRYNENPYNGWPVEKLDSFFKELSKLAGAKSKCPIGSFLDTQRFVKDGRFGHRYEGCLYFFYESVLKDLTTQWPNLNGGISFFYDQNEDNEEWTSHVEKMHRRYSKLNPRIRELTFANKKDHPGLQAADMFAYRLNQIARKYCGYDAPTSGEAGLEFDRNLFGGFAANEMERIITNLRRR